MAVIHDFRRHRPDMTTSARRGLVIFLMIDMALILAYLIAGTLRVSGIVPENGLRPLFLENDKGLAERILHLKWLATAVILAIGAMRWRSGTLASIALVFALMFLDDALTIHELGGRALGAALGLGPDRAESYGSIMVFAMMGTPALLLLGLNLARASAAERRRVMPILMVCVGLVAVGIGVDFLHGTIKGMLSPGAVQTVVNAVMVVLEDGGELILGSFAIIAAIMLTWDQRPGAPAAK